MREFYTRMAHAMACNKKMYVVVPCQATPPALSEYDTKRVPTGRIYVTPNSQQRVEFWSDAKNTPTEVVLRHQLKNTHQESNNRTFAYK